MTRPEITQRDLRSRSEETPSRRRFVPRNEFAATSRNAATINIEAFRADQAVLDPHEQQRP